MHRPFFMCFTTALAAMLLTMTACNSTNEIPATKPALKTLLSPFLVGAAVNQQQVDGSLPQDAALLQQHFNAVTPENMMKWEAIHPAPETYHFAPADALIEFANTHSMAVTGHTLIWHSQAPDWIFENDDGSTVSRTTLLQRMQSHIATVAGRYKNTIKGWDVVNEALNEDGTLRASKWQQIVGDDYIAEAFKMAAQAAPDAELYYNDYNLFAPDKRAGAVRLIKSLQAQGIRIDGIGMQGHYTLTHPALQEVEASIEAFAALGIKVMITELDVSVIPFPGEPEDGAEVSLNVAMDESLNPYPDTLPAAINQQLAARYQDLFAVFRRHQNSLSRITFWGVHDAQSWRNNWPVKGRTDYPLLIDKNRQLKPFATTL